MSLDLEKLLCTLEGDSPAGTNEEYNQLYAQLDEFAIGKPSSTMGDSVIEGVDPDWRALRNACLDLWQKTRDLRVAMYLCIAEFSLEGLKGFSDALSVVEYLVTDLWKDFYPQLDPDDDNDPTERLNILAMISPVPGTYSDPLMFINKFRTVCLVEGKKYTLRDLLIVNGELDAGDTVINPAIFQGEMRAVPMEVMQQNKDLTEKVIGQLNHISSTIGEYLPDISVSSVSLLAELKQLQRFYAAYLLPQQAQTASTEGGDGQEAAGEGVASGGVRQSAFMDITTYVPSSRAEALLLLQKGAEYFQNAEPTSPVPFLVARAVRMATMSFLDLLGDVEPTAMEKGREIFGIKPDDGNTEN